MRAPPLPGAVALVVLTLAGCGNTTTRTAIKTTAVASPCVSGTMGCAVTPAKFGVGPSGLPGKTLIPDVSEYQPCALHSEAIFRVYEAGTGREDSAARCHAQELGRLHVWAGVYAFLRSSTNCTAIADTTVRIVRSLPVKVRVVIGDAETGIREGKVRCFLREVERLGYPAREYTCPGCGDEQVGPVWIAAYPFRPTGRWIAHQFSDNFNCRGVRGDCSIDEGILSIGKPSPRPKPRPVRRRELLARRQHLRVFLAENSCRRRRAHREHLGPRCRGAFAAGDRVNRELAKL